MTNPTIDPISYNAGIEAAAKALREHEMKGRITVPWDRVPKSQKAKWLEKASIVVAALHRTEPQTAPDDASTIETLKRALEKIAGVIGADRELTQAGHDAVAEIAKQCVPIFEAAGMEEAEGRYGFCG